MLSRVDLLARSRMGCPAHNGWTTPLHFAAQQGNLQVVQWLVQNCDDLLNPIDSNNDTALDIAYYEKHTEVVDWLKADGGKGRRYIVMQQRAFENVCILKVYQLQFLAQVTKSFLTHILSIEFNIF
ncbi:MAG: ankyrin repeat domain-containing protein [Parachlamydiaceae bacterium]